MAIDYADYHPQFKKIARFVIAFKARNYCEHCGVRNNSVGQWHRTRKGEPPEWEPICGNAEADDIGAGFLSYGQARQWAREYNRFIAEPNGEQPLRVVKLACAHLDHDIANNDLDNLAALCQGCHRHHDSQDNAERRRYGKKGQHRYQPRLFKDSKYAPDPLKGPIKKKVRIKRKYTRKQPIASALHKK